MTSANDVTVYVDPPSHHFLHDKLFDPATAAQGGDDIQAPYIAIRDVFAADGIPVHTADRLPAAPDGRRNIYVTLGRVPDYPALSGRSDVVLSAHLITECPIVEPSLFAALPAAARFTRRIFTVCDGDALLPFTGSPVATTRYVWPQCRDGVHDDVWRRTERGFLAMINANKLPRLYDRELYTERLRAVEFFHRYGEMDLYGKGWDRMPHRVGKTWVPWTFRLGYRAAWEAWQHVLPNPLFKAAAEASRGAIGRKADVLGRYTFAICFENMVLQGWVTEKIFDCFYAGCVPVYWGAPDVTERIPAETFIDMRQFSGYPELRSFLHDLPPAAVTRYREAARAFIESPAYEPFRPRAFAERFRRIVREDLEAA